MKQSSPKVLVLDIETCPLLSLHFSLRDNFLTPRSMVKGYFNRTRIICIQYRWEHERKTKLLTWGESEEDEVQMIKDCDALMEEADVIITKNGDRFDLKHLATYRMVYDLPGLEVNSKSDDLEKQVRKNFNFPSFGLDYISELLGFGGKSPMQFSDWKEIVYYRLAQLSPKNKTAEEMLTLLTGEEYGTIIKRGKKALNKMFKYGMKDTTDTLEVWKYCKKHFKPKLNMNTFINDSEIRCIRCGSNNVHKNGTAANGKTRYQRYRCSDCQGYAGRAPISKSGKVGKIG